MSRLLPFCTSRRIFSGTVRRASGLALAFWLALSGAGWAQRSAAPPPPEDPPLPVQPFVDPTQSGDQIMQLQIPPGQGGAPAVPLRPQPSVLPGELSATAEFEPGVISFKRFGQYRVTIIGAQQAAELPDPLPVPDGLVVNDASRTFGVQSVNGRVVQSITFSFSVTAVKSGTFILPSFTARIGGVGVTVPAAKVVVREPADGEELYRNARAILDLRPGEYFVGQTINTRLLVIDSPDEVAQAIANVSKPSGDFLFRNHSGAPRETFTVDGRSESGLAMPIQLTPIKPGANEVSLQAIAFINRITGPGGPGIRRAPGAMSGFTAQTILDTPPVEIIVKPLPESGRLPGFTGAIGRFELSQPQLSAREVKVGDPLIIAVTISGEGNLEAIRPPELPSSDDWQSFTPTSDVERDGLTGRGSKVFTYTLIPRHADVRAAPAIPFSYFDPERKEYVALTIPPVPVKVIPAADAGSAPPSSAEPIAVSENPPAAAPPARRILTGLADQPGIWRRHVSPVAFRPWFWLWQALPACALLLLALWRRRQDFLSRHPEIVRRRRARIAVRRQLRRARAAAARRDPKGFVAAGVEAIREAASPLDSTRAQSLVLEEVLARLDAAERDGESGAIVRKLFEAAHAADLSGHPPAPNGVVELLPELERTVRRIGNQSS